VPLFGLEGDVGNLGLNGIARSYTPFVSRGHILAHGSRLLPERARPPRRQYIQRSRKRARHGRRESDRAASRL